jgi:6-phosphogluconolactonase
MIFYTGSYTNDVSPAPDPKGLGIGCLDLDQANGAIKLLHYTKQRNPSYLTISKDQKYLYAVEELTEDLNPMVFSYKIESTGKLSKINSQNLKGDYACHLAIVENRLIVANYMTGNALSFPILADGRLDSCHQIIEHKGTGPSAERHEGPHAHMVYPFKKGCFYLVDLGIDIAKAYRINYETKNWQAIPEFDIHIESGAGARHLIMDASENFAFVLSELTGEIFVIEKQKNSCKQIQKISFIPQDFKQGFGGAAIRLHPNEQFLYASSTRPDSIAILKVDKLSKMLLLIAHQSTEGLTPRDFDIDPSGNWLIAANQDSDTLVVFKINQESGTLQKCSTFSVETPTNICWLSYREK